MILRKLNLVFLFVLAVNAIFAGYLFMRDPGGAALGINTSVLKYSPFKDFFIPGLVLFSVNGLFAVFTGFMLVSQWKTGPLLLAVQGLLLMGWIGIQMLMLRECNLLHLAFGGLGLFFIGSGIYLYRAAKQ